MNYEPRPMDTSDVVLSKDLLALTEQIAANTHDVWACGRIREGWTYGPERNDVLKQTPCLIPYEDLPDSEKEFDRATAMEAIKLIVKMGYIITKVDSSAP